VSLARILSPPALKSLKLRVAIRAGSQPLFASALGGFGLFAWLRRRRDNRRRGAFGPKLL